MRFNRTVSALAISTALASTPLKAEDTTAIAFEIAPQPVNEALQQFAEQSGFQMAFLADSASGLTARGLEGSYTPAEAMRSLLDGTGLAFRQIDGRTIAIMRKDSKLEESGLSQRPQFASADPMAASPVAAAQAGVQAAGAASGADEEDAFTMEAIVVTGSRIQRTGATTPTPVTMLDAETLSLNGDTRLADTLNQLPALGATQTDANTNFNPQEAGTNFLDLRRLGIDRTLVLVDGRRHVGSRPGSAAVDTNTIPNALVERVEVITGGASAVYGADAVSGVVNIIMKDDFEGLKVDAQTGITDEGDGESYQLSLTGGMNFDDKRGNVFFNATYDRTEDIVGSDRGWRMQKLRFAPNPADTGPNDGIPGQILFGDTGFISTPPGGRVIGQGGQLFEGAGGPFTFDGQGNLISQNLGELPASFLSSGGDTADLAQFDLLQVPVERLIVSGGVTYQVSDSVDFFARAKFANTQSSTFGQPTFSLPSVEPMLIQADNPFVPQELRDVLAANGEDAFFVGRTNVDQGAARSRSDRDTVQIYTGFEGDISSNLDFAVHYQYGRSDNSTEFINAQVPSRFQQALNAVEDPDTGEIVCADPSGGCVPLNVLGRNAATPEAIAFTHADFLTFGEVEQHVVNGTVSGDTSGSFEPLAGPVGFAAGFEYRDESAETEEGFLRNTGNVFSSPPIGDVNGSFDVWEAFAEVSVPIVRDAAFAEEINLEGAIRFGDYSTIGSTTAWKVSGDWALNSSIRFRGAFSVAVRAPNIGELFGPTDVENLFLEDPCDTDNLDSGSGNRRDNCAALGLPADFQSQSLNRTNTVVTGGNPDLSEEEADTITIGAVLTPSFLPGLTLSVDYWDIEITDAINSFPAQALVRNCVDADTINNPFCDQITRQSNGNFDVIESRLINVAAFEAAGIDFDASYFVDMESATDGSVPGELDISLVGNWVDKLAFFSQEEGAPDREAGELGDPDFQANLRATYSLEKWTFSVEERYMASQRFDLGESLEARDPNSAGDQWYTDIHVRYNLGEQSHVWFGVDNLFDNNPPRIARIPEIRSFTGDSTQFDQVGRFFSIGTSLTF
ncbi:TonB-dependent receptor domain-containing protein [Yunchengibacter salinarum]|uniref:TonB-dependent receptor domain-containing protein n=1 Tax=Yunchengibacter salinarum TaxID=3133399 RepID=UPI0035B5943A